MQIYKPHLHLQLASSGDPQALSIVVKMPAEETISASPTESVSGDTRTIMYAIISSSDPGSHQVERIRSFSVDEIDLSSEKFYKVLIGDPESVGGTKGSGAGTYAKGDPI